MQFHPCSPADWYILAHTVLGDKAAYISTSSDEVEKRIAPGGRSLIHDDGRILAAGGITDHWAPGSPNRVGSVWLMIKPDDFSAALRGRIARSLRHELYRLILEGHYGLVESNVNRVDAVGNRFIQWLGFSPSAMRMRFGPSGEDMILYSLRGEHVRLRNRGGGPSGRWNGIVRGRQPTGGERTS